MYDATIKLRADEADAMRGVDHLGKGIESLTEAVRHYVRESENANRYSTENAKALSEMGDALADFGGPAGEFAAEAIDIAADHWDKYIQKVYAAGDATLRAATLQREAVRQLSDDSTVTPANLEKNVNDISSRTGIDRGELFGRAAKGFALSDESDREVLRDLRREAFSEAGIGERWQKTSPTQRNTAIDAAFKGASSDLEALNGPEGVVRKGLEKYLEELGSFGQYDAILSNIGLHSFAKALPSWDRAVQLGWEYDRSSEEPVDKAINILRERRSNAIYTGDADSVSGKEKLDRVDEMIALLERIAETTANQDVRIVDDERPQAAMRQRASAPPISKLGRKD